MILSYSRFFFFFSSSYFTHSGLSSFYYSQESQIIRLTHGGILLFFITCLFSLSLFLHFTPFLYTWFLRLLNALRSLVIILYISSFTRFLAFSYFNALVSAIVIIPPFCNFHLVFGPRLSYFVWRSLIARFLYSISYALYKILFVPLLNNSQWRYNGELNKDLILSPYLIKP